MTKLKLRGRLPRRIELSEIGSTCIANAFDDPGDYTISEFVFTGMSPDPATATLKALVEKIERDAYAAGARKSLASCQTERSDGFAAYPLGIGGVDERKQARANAWHEAFERFTWACWWDNADISHQSRRCTEDSLSKASWSLISALNKIMPLKEVFEIIPDTDNDDAEAVIVFAELEGGGFVSGGAAGRKDDRDVIVYRALSELVRHGLAAFHFRNNGTKPKSFYEKRLHFFAFEAAGSELLKRRLSQVGKTRIQIPVLEIDAEIPHDLSDLVYVHRCYFKDQPPFIGGDIQRFCL